MCALTSVYVFSALCVINAKCSVKALLTFLVCDDCKNVCRGFVIQTYTNLWPLFVSASKNTVTKKKVVQLAYCKRTVVFAAKLTAEAKIKAPSTHIR